MAHQTLPVRIRPEEIKLFLMANSRAEYMSIALNSPSLRFYHTTRRLYS